MFCGLKGATLMSLFAKARQSPAAIRDFPTSEPVPMSMMARAVMTSRDDMGVGAHHIAAPQTGGRKIVAAGIVTDEERFASALPINGRIVKLMPAQLASKRQGAVLREPPVAQMKLAIG